MNKIFEPKIKWGGNWTEEKLEAFQEYVKAYLKIINAQKRKFNGWPTTIYFDGFAGSGKRPKSNYKNENTLFSDYFVKEEAEVYKGSAERVLGLNQKFDYYYFIDIDKSSIDSLKDILTSKGLVNENCFFIHDDVNNQLSFLSDFLDNKKAALVLLDPFGMQINWSSIEKLKGKRVDLWVLIPSGVIINRFLDKKGKLLFKNKLSSYFGMSLDDIKKIFYETNRVKNLFYTFEIKSKISDPINKIAEIYIERLKNIFKYVSEKPLRLLNTKNVPIYHFVFASNNQTAYKIANQIIEKKNK